MRLELGATVRSADGQDVGQIDQLVVDSERRAVAYFILRTGRFHSHDFVVPLDTVRSVDDDNTIHLILEATQVRALPEFEQANFVVSDMSATELRQAMPAGDSTYLPAPSADAQWRYLVPTSSPGVLIPSGSSERSTPEGHVYDPASSGIMGTEDPMDETVSTISSLPEWDYRIGTHTKVVTRDDHSVGTFHEIDVDSDGKPQAIVIVSGLFHRAEHTIPMVRVRSADSEQILLAMTRDEYEQWAKEIAEEASSG